MARAPIIQLAETISTNKDAMRLALQGEPLPLWVSAERQTGGRGRAGRVWISIPGNLHASVAFSSGARPEQAGQIALVAGLAMFHAVKKHADARQAAMLRLKWPNDLLIGTAKVGGILVESTIQPQADGLVAVVGFGLNVTAAPDGLDRDATALRDHGCHVSAAELLAALTEQLESWLEIWNDGSGFSDVRREWLQHGGHFGEKISVNTGTGLVTGSYQGLSETGALLVAIGDKLEIFTFGDVALAGGGGNETG